MKKRPSVKTKMIEFRNPYHIEPPGALREILSHPIKESEALEMKSRLVWFLWIGIKTCAIPKTLKKNGWII